MDLDEKVLKIQDNIAMLPSLSRDEFEAKRSETNELIKELEQYLDMDHLKISEIRN